MGFISFDIKQRYSATGIYWLITVIFTCFWLQWLTDDHTLRELMLTDRLGLPLLSHLFIHAHIIHLAWNLLFLYLAGYIVCVRFGSVVLVVLFVWFGLWAGLAHVVLDGREAAGASGSVSGLIAFTVALNARTRLSFLNHAVTVPYWSVFIFWLVKDLALLFLPSMHSASYAHFGGLLAGLATGVAWRTFQRVPETGQSG